jgi:anaerobic selenocysteine-containing dehydrogenase
MLCEAACGVVATVEDGRMLRVVGDHDDPFSQGHICPKAAALDDIRTDPDRVLSPLRRGEAGFEPTSWDDALSEAGARIAAIQNEHGPSSVALYLGNPIAHSYTGILYALGLSETLGTRARFSATSLDQLPQMLAALQVFGHQALLAVPDVDRTDFLLIMGGNPVVSNGSIMTAPGIEDRLRKIRARGGKIVVVDPRRSETAKLADAHHFIRPGADALLLMALLHTIFADKKVKLGRLAPFTRGLPALERAASAYPPERVAEATGIEAGTIRALAHAFADAPSAACYARLGLCTQDLGSLSTWLALALSTVTGNTDRPGGMMFTTPAADVVPLLAALGQRGSFGQYKSRVRGLPEFGGELPTAVLAEEIETPGPGQIRALITVAGNPALSAPNGSRLERAMSRLECMVSIDLYKNETTRHAHYLLPSTFGLERDHYDLALNAVSVRNTARYARAVFPPAGQTRHDWRILSDLSSAIASRRAGPRGALTSVASRLFGLLGPERVLDGLLRVGPHRLTLRRLEAQPHGIDLGPLEPRLPARLYTKSKRIELAPELYLGQLHRLDERIARAAAEPMSLVLIGRRQLRSNNSWMHNSARLMKGRERCTLLMHPEDAAVRGLATGTKVCVASSVGEIQALLEVSDEMGRGVVSLPHGWGHHREGAALRVARERAGASINDVMDDARVDPLTGAAAFSGLSVEVRSPATAVTETAPALATA